MLSAINNHCFRHCLGHLGLMRYWCLFISKKYAKLEEHSESADLRWDQHKLSSNSNKYQFWNIILKNASSCHGKVLNNSDFIALRIWQGHYTKNVAMATMITHFDRTYKELSKGCSPNFLSLIEVETNWFESSILSCKNKMAVMAAFLK